MPEFKNLEDNISSQEAGLTLGRVRDINGNDWEKRDDNVLKRYLAQTNMTPDQKLKMRGLIDMRNWMELHVELDQIMLRADDDDTIRINKAKEMIDKIIRQEKIT